MESAERECEAMRMADEDIRNSQEREQQFIAAIRQSPASRNAYCHVRPRYSGGSPAQVDLSTMVHVAVNEEESYAQTMTGLYGEAERAKAVRLGLKGVCYVRWEKGPKIYRYDVLTGETRLEPKRLEQKDLERVRLLRNWLEFTPDSMTDLQKAELALLEERAELHRQTI